MSLWSSIWRRRPGSARPDPRRVRRRLQGGSGRRRAGRFQGQGESVRADLRASSSAILPYTNADWEKLSIFLNFLVPKLPAPQEEDLSKGILEAIDMDSYRVEKQAAQRDRNWPIKMPRSTRSPPTAAAASRSLNSTGCPISSEAFNDLFGNIAWEDGDRIRQLIANEIPTQGRGRHRLSEREAELGQAERPHRARQGARARHHRTDEGRHGTVQTVQRQPRIQAMAGRYHLLGDI